MAKIQKITPNLWFNDQAEEAVQYYASIFKNSRIGRVSRYVNDGNEHHRVREGTVMTIEFQLEGQEFVALNGGPLYNFTEAFSLIVNCETQEEVDYYWDKLSEGGDEGAQVCGWLKDKFGVSWQIVPVFLTEVVHDPNPVKIQKVLQAMYRMKKLDIPTLQQAYEQA
ncbi:VOC family protein [Paenibacillus sp. HJGM_3]|uniref:VOC family protein n=1 Tax=Paenibacillus sp. HJGM_3 TaxID=3379816 RepID=UPI00385E4819